MNTNGRLIVFDELAEGVGGLVVDHVAVVITEGYEAGRGAHFLGKA
jgi:hypothetical protein